MTVLTRDTAARIIHLEELKDRAVQGETVDELQQVLHELITWLQRSEVASHERWASEIANEDRVLRQLVREAFDHFENPDSTVDIREWVKVARAVIG